MENTSDSITEPSNNGQKPLKIGFLSLHKNTIIFYTFCIFLGYLNSSLSYEIYLGLNLFAYLFSFTGIPLGILFGVTFRIFDSFDSAVPIMFLLILLVEIPLASLICLRIFKRFFSSEMEKKHSYIRILIIFIISAIIFNLNLYYQQRQNQKQLEKTYQQETGSKQYDFSKGSTFITESKTVKYNLQTSQNKAIWVEDLGLNGQKTIFLLDFNNDTGKGKISKIADFNPKDQVYLEKDSDNLTFSLNKIYWVKNGEDLYRYNLTSTKQDFLERGVRNVFSVYKNTLLVRQDITAAGEEHILDSALYLYDLDKKTYVKTPMSAPLKIKDDFICFSNHQDKVGIHKIGTDNYFEFSPYLDGYDSIKKLSLSVLDCNKDFILYKLGLTDANPFNRYGYKDQKSEEQYRIFNGQNQKEITIMRAPENLFLGDAKLLGSQIIYSLDSFDKEGSGDATNNKTSQIKLYDLLTGEEKDILAERLREWDILGDHLIYIVNTGSKKDVGLNPTPLMMMKIPISSKPLLSGDKIIQLAPTVFPSPSNNKTAELKNYTSPDNKYSFSIPSNWAVEASQNVYNAYSPCSYHTGDICSKISILTFEKPLEVEDFSDRQTILNKTSIKLDSENATSFEGHYNEYYGSDTHLEGFRYGIVTKHNNLSYIIWYEEQQRNKVYKEANWENKRLFDQIVTTFKFLE